MQRSRLILIPLFKGLQMTTEGTPLTETVFNLDPREFQGLLPHAEQLILYYNTVGRTSAFEWSVFLVPGFDRDHEGQALNLFGSNFIASAGPGRAEYGTTSSFQLFGRLEARCRNATGANGVNAAVTSAVLGVKTVGM